MPSTTPRTISKTEQRELDRHASLVEAFGEAFGAVESTDGAFEWSESEQRAIPTELGAELEAKRDKIGAELAAAAAKLRKRGYILTNDDSRPIAPEPTNTEESKMTTEIAKTIDEIAAAKPAKPAGKRNGKAPAAAKPAAAKPESVEFEWPTPPAELLLEYVTENISADADAPNKGLPFINDAGVLRIRAEHWREWLAAKNIAAPKLEAGRPIRELGFAMKPFPLPGEARSHGFYTGPAPKGMSKLPRRAVQRAAAAPRSPFAKLTAPQIGVLKSALANFKGNAAAKAIRDELAAMVDAASEKIAADEK